MMNHLISIDQFDRKKLDDFFEQCDKTPNSSWLIGTQQMASLFFEPSTRTRLSFEAVFNKMGGKVLSITGQEGCSLAKGETLEDTIKTVNAYADLIVLRHAAEGAAARAARVSKVPVINAGDGSGEHPTQALLDAYTIYKKHKRLNDLHVMIVGDVKHSRTIHSLLKLLNNYDGINLILVPFSRCNESINAFIENPRFQTVQTYYDDEPSINMLDTAVKRHAPNVLYMTRLQKERWKPFDYQSEWSQKEHNYGLTLNHMEYLPDDCIILHPLPRVNEIDPAIDFDKRAVYFTDQLQSGLEVRRALISKLLQGYKF